MLAGLRRRGWAGRIVWAFAPVQDRHAAPAITRALQDLAACEPVEVIVVARGGGSLADLFAFCDETLCRTVAMLRVPVISSVGHHTDHTLIDDVAAVACSTPTHAAEAAVAVDCAAARAVAARARPPGWSARARARSSTARARSPGSRARPPTTSRATARGCTSSCASCGPRAPARWRRASARTAAAPPRWIANGQLGRARAPAARARSRLALAAHDPQRTLERGYALVEAADGSPVTSAAAAAAQPELALRMHDGAVRVRPGGGVPSEPR